MTEAQLQQQMVIEFRNNYKGLIFAVPNGGSRNPIEAKNLKLTGSLAGVSDLIVIQQNRIIFVEVKIEKGIQSDAQIKFQNNVELLGFDYFLVRSLEEFKAIL
ncbi:MAG: VRR-NUC domain-containing protein [Flavobacterium sp.]|nr:VRR-NUC domain-containing protein [Flavobacterium sp.]